MIDYKDKISELKGRIILVVGMLLFVLILLNGLDVFGLTIFTTNETTGYNWSAGTFYQTNISNGENVSLNDTLDNYTKLLLHFDGADDCDRLINNLSSYYSKIYKLDNQLLNWNTNKGEKYEAA